jgi:hypothetical protein
MATFTRVFDGLNPDAYDVEAVNLLVEQGACPDTAQQHMETIRTEGFGVVYVENSRVLGAMSLLQVDDEMNVHAFAVRPGNYPDGYREDIGSLMLIQAAWDTEKRRMPDGTRGRATSISVFPESATAQMYAANGFEVEMDGDGDYVLRANPQSIFQAVAGGIGRRRGEGGAEA